MILHEKTFELLGYKFENTSVWSNFYCSCDYCGNEFVRSKRNINAGRKIIQKDSCNSKECVKSKGKNLS